MFIAPQLIGSQNRLTAFLDTIESVDGTSDISGFVMAQKAGTPSPPPRRKFNHPEPSASAVSVLCTVWLHRMAYYWVLHTQFLLHFTSCYIEDMCTVHCRGLRMSWRLLTSLRLHYWTLERSFRLRWGTPHSSLCGHNWLTTPSTIPWNKKLYFVETCQWQSCRYNIHPNCTLLISVRPSKLLTW